MASKKVILVTGANQGIGYDTSYAIAAASPNNHVILGSRNLARGTKALEELTAQKLPGTFSLLEVDITNDDSINAAAAQITADFGVLDVLVNNAGMIIMKPKDRRSELMETFNSNSVGPLVLTEALLPLLKKSSDPRIINVSSELGSISERLNPDTFAYNLPAEAYRISKTALNMASASMHVTYKSWGAKVWAFDPGFVLTNLSGEDDRQRRVDMGAENSGTSAEGIAEIVEGKRDAEVGLFVRRKGERWDW